MYQNKLNYNRKKTEIILIPKNSNALTSPSNKEYSLKQNFFDPSKHSPPNNFIIKLKNRVSLYESFNNNDNFISE
jgi:hypothetical protein